MKKGNVIPRKATKLSVTFTHDSGYHKAGESTVVEKNEFGDWTDGKFRYLVAHLRNAEHCSLSVIA